jgi:hypothetical protein
MDMVERVARALAPLSWRALGLCDTLAHKNRRKASLRHARAAIEAMREPNDRMVDAGDIVTGYPIKDIFSFKVWEVMIDAALNAEDS